MPAAQLRAVLINGTLKFAGFLAISEVLDIIWLATTRSSGFVKFIVIANLFVKVGIYPSFLPKKVGQALNEAHVPIYL